MKNLDSQIQKLAKEMNVSAADVKCFAQSVANSMISDKLTQEHAKQVDLVTAYAGHAIRKFKQFQTKVLTNPEAKKALISKVYIDVKNFNDNAKTFDDLND